MGLENWKSRLHDLEAYLDEIEKLALSRLATDYGDPDPQTRSRWKAVFDGWKEEMKATLPVCVNENRCWRRIQYLLESFTRDVTRGLDVLDRNGDVVSQMRARIVLATVQAKSPPSIPDWVDDTHHPIPVPITVRRLAELGDRLRSMQNKINEARRPSYEWNKLTVWTEAIETAMTLHVWLDPEWAKINYMLDEIMSYFEKGGDLLDDSGQIKQNLTFQGLLNAMKEPWIFKQRFPRQGLILRSLESTRRISSRVARRHGIQTQGVAEEGGSYF